jgi:hypothetical protein
MIPALAPQRRRRGSRHRRQPIGTPINKARPPKAKARPTASFTYRTRAAVYHAVHDGKAWRIRRFET